MTVRAVDLQTMIPRLNEAGRVQHQAEQLPQSASQVLAMSEQVRAREAQSQVKAKLNVEHAGIQKDGRGQGGGGQPGPGKERKGSAQAGSKPATEPGRGHRLDVKL